MKLVRLETFCTKYAGLVRATADTGAQGWGQVSTYHADISALVLHRQVAPHALGQEISPPPFDGLCDLIFAREHKFPGSYLCRAAGGVDTALWDLWGKTTQKTVCELLGGKPRPLRVYASSMRRDISPKDETERFLRLREECGYDAFKFRIGKECGGDQDEWEGRTEEIIPAMRRTLGGGAALLADANSCYSPKKAVEVGRILEDNGICHYEEPCPYWKPEWTKEVAEELKIDITGGEQDCDLALWRYLISGGVMDVAQPDICYVGGMSRALRVAKMAQEAGMPLTPHAANLSLVTVFTLHLMGALKNAGPYVEFSIEGADYYPWQAGIYDDMPTAKDGKANIPAAPGWGVQIREEWLARAQYQKSEIN